jgi:hypothetical protein
MRRGDQNADVVMLTHESLAASLDQALADIDAETFAVERTRVLPVILA